MKIRDRIKEFRRVKASELLPCPRNWRKHPEAQQNALRNILAEVGIVDVLLVRETPNGLMLIDGHLRAETDGDVEWPVAVLDVTEKEADLLLASVDPIAEMAEPDPEKLADLLSTLDIESEELKALLEAKAGVDAEPVEGLTDPDEVPEVPDEPVTQPGDLWILGEHRLLCGDSTKAEDVARVMNGELAVMMSTDPPYGVDFAGAKYNPKAKDWAGIEGDKVQGEDLRAFIFAMLKTWFPHMNEQAAFYLWTAAMTEGAAAGIQDAGLHIQSQIIWNKNCLVLGQADYHWKHENCWYAFWKGKKHHWYGGRDKTTVWEVSKVANSNYVHPMQKPVELYAIPMRHHTLEGEVVAEPFAGSGSQFMAGEQLGRRVFGTEISPHFCDVIVQRWEAFTGKQAVLEQRGI